MFFSLGVPDVSFSFDVSLVTMDLWQEYCTSDAMFSSWHPIRWPEILICPITGDVAFNHYVNRVLWIECLCSPCPLLSRFMLNPASNVIILGVGAFGR